MWERLDETVVRGLNHPKCVTIYAYVHQDRKKCSLAIFWNSYFDFLEAFFSKPKAYFDLKWKNWGNFQFVNVYVPISSVKIQHIVNDKHSQNRKGFCYFRKLRKRTLIWQFQWSKTTHWLFYDKYGGHDAKHLWWLDTSNNWTR